VHTGSNLLDVFLLLRGVPFSRLLGGNSIVDILLWQWNQMVQVLELQIFEFVLR
jgi:hypothetical protein